LRTAALPDRLTCRSLSDLSESCVFDRCYSLNDELFNVRLSRQFLYLMSSAGDIMQHDNYLLLLDSESPVSQLGMACDPGRQMVFAATGEPHIYVVWHPDLEPDLTDAGWSKNWLEDAQMSLLDLDYDAGTITKETGEHEASSSSSSTSADTASQKRSLVLSESSSRELEQEQAAGTKLTMSRQASSSPDPWPAPAVAAPATGRICTRQQRMKSQRRSRTRFTAEQTDTCAECSTSGRRGIRLQGASESVQNDHSRWVEGLHAQSLLSAQRIEPSKFAAADATSCSGSGQQRPSSAVLMLTLAGMPHGPEFESNCAGTAVAASATGQSATRLLYWWAAIRSSRSWKQLRIFFPELLCGPARLSTLHLSPVQSTNNRGLQSPPAASNRRPASPASDWLSSKPAVIEFKLRSALLSNL
uniref:WD_REPEATS_REGION domain-containing protein n=1 Tax=Macrostomum lignano TaxID=282301 RepID=A0A1I8JQ37_9PLAT